jgi:hypothetical protein
VLQQWHLFPDFAEVKLRVNFATDPQINSHHSYQGCSHKKPTKLLGMLPPASMQFCEVLDSSVTGCSS